MSNKYQNGKIYKIVSADYSKCYIGSTCESLSQRLARHRAYYFEYLRGNKTHAKMTSTLLFDAFGVENCKLEWVEDYPCNFKHELHTREGQHIRNTDCVNKVIAGRTKQEYIEDNWDKISANAKTYKLEHQEELKQYREDNAEHFRQKAKERYIEKKEEVNKKHREHYIQNHEATKARQKKNYELSKQTKQFLYFTEQIVYISFGY